MRFNVVPLRAQCPTCGRPIDVMEPFDEAPMRIVLEPCGHQVSPADLGIEAPA